MLTEILSIITIIISILALTIAIITWKSNMRATRNITHYDVVAQADSMLAGNSKLLRFHGIDPGTIEEKYGVDSTDLSYLALSFNAGSISNLLSKDGDKEPFKEGEYRYDILKNESTQKAFPLIKLLFDSKNLYMARCEKTIRFIKKMDANNKHDKNT